ncbi:MAG: hypothetical protein RSB38_08730 [Oscillospiraceae bacterium]
MKEKAIAASEEITENSNGAINKLHELLCCGNERVELSAAKEILAIVKAKEKISDVENLDDETPQTLNINIKII